MARTSHQQAKEAGTLLKRNTTRYDGDGARDDSGGSQSSDGTANDQHVRRNSGTAKQRAELEEAEEYEERPL